jgi:hypothetical protein
LKKKLTGSHFRAGFASTHHQRSANKIARHKAEQALQFRFEHITTFVLPLALLILLMHSKSSLFSILTPTPRPAWLFNEFPQSNKHC